MIVLYVDGSSTYYSGKNKPGNYNKTFIHGWGVVAHHGDTSVEFQGCRLVKSHQVGWYEISAFIEGFLYAKSHGFKNDQMSFYTDDESVAYVGQFRRTGRGASYTVFQEKLEQICKEFYPNVEGLCEELLQCLEEARFTKVKGHATCVYNLRVDYLAKYARDVHLDPETQLKGFESWAAEGFPRWTGDSWFPAFMGTQQ